MMVKNRLPLSPNTLVVWALLFAVVGIGNLWIGHSKRLYYVDAISKTQAKQEVSADKRSIMRRRVHSRIDYYSLVYNGGICFLTLSVVLISLAMIRPGNTESSSESNGQNS